MRLRLAVVLVLTAFGALAWRATLYHVEPRGASPRPLALRAVPERSTAEFDAVLPIVPAGSERLVPGGQVLIVHYWAPWERHSGPQAVALDSLRVLLGPGAVRIAVVCFDPYPSVTRYVARMRLRLPVMLDLRHALADRLPCPIIPYTYVIDRQGRIAVAQPGEVDWLSPETRAALARVIAEPATSAAPAAGNTTPRRPQGHRGDRTAPETQAREVSAGRAGQTARSAAAAPKSTAT